MRATLPNLFAFLTGVLFAIGLGIGGMTQPSKVVGFLDVTGAWDPSLAFVMAAAVGVHALVYRRVRAMPSPWLAERFGIPTRRDLNTRLLAGAAMFGLGWGLAGYCPGPGIVASATGTRTALLFMGAMVVGMLSFDQVGVRLQRARARRARPEQGAESASTEPVR